MTRGRLHTVWCSLHFYRMLRRLSRRPGNLDRASRSDQVRPLRAFVFVLVGSVAAASWVSWYASRVNSVC